MPNINTKTYVDIHTTGERREFGSVREYDKFLKAHNARVVTPKDIEKMRHIDPNQKSDYKKLAEEAWCNRHKFMKEARERIAKEKYELRNGRIR